MEFMSEGASKTQSGSAPVLFNALLHPHRSLSRRGFIILMTFVGLISLTVGGVFYFQGAWPIFGFYGLDMLVLFLFMRANYRSGRVYERLHLTPAVLTVERGDHTGPRSSDQMQPTWLRVSIDDPPRHESQIRLSSHGRTIVVGSFLPPPERVEVAGALNQALDRLRDPAYLARLPA
ncbi:MAG: DUF2244 domain-containing protein, partial [Pseudomonadota bacterium]